MRFSSVAMMAGTAAAAIETDYTTKQITITACPETVTDCPARSKTTSVTTSLIPLTTSTVYTTQLHTVTSCEPTVTNCPAHSTITITETIPVSTTVCPVGPTSAPAWSNSTVPAGPCGGKPCPPASVPTNGGSVPAKPSSPASVVPVCPGTSVTAITKSYTTVLTSVEYQTIQVPCPTKGPSGTVTPPAVTPAPPAGNTTKPVNPPPVTAGAASFAGSALFAAAAGVAAYVFA